jgi:hypothetical protein
MTKVIAYQFEGNIAVTTPAPGLDINFVAEKDVPFGCPFVIVDSSTTYDIDFGKPDGIGQNPATHTPGDIQ